MYTEKGDRVTRRRHEMICVEPAHYKKFVGNTIHSLRLSSSSRCGKVMVNYMQSLHTHTHTHTDNLRRTIMM